jgi:predicted HTH domain antitoxin
MMEYWNIVFKRIIPLFQYSSNDLKEAPYIEKVERS